MQLENKTALLTGASGGIGHAIATELDKRVGRLLLVGRNHEKLQRLQKSLTGRHRLIVADLNTPAGRAAVIEVCSEEHLDLYVNGCGVMDFQFVENQRSELIDQMINTNFLAPVLLCQQLIPLLKARPEAAILQIGSIFGSIGHPGFAAYCGSKFGLRGFTEALQRELSDSTIQVSYLAPRATRTDFNSASVTALNKALGNATDSPQCVAKEAIKLLGKRPGQRFMGWSESLFVRINVLFPGLVHKALVNKLSLIRLHADK